jgi:NAD(P)-dependent dehydrogenase (short-subunit alcohol dehydrogenase family)
MSSTSRFTDKVAFITGATAGIGRATALAYAEEGARVVVADRPGSGHEQTAMLITQAGGTATAIDCDVTDAAQVVAALDRTVAAYGRLDVAYNNGGTEQSQTTLADLDDDEFDRIVAVDVRGVYLCMKHQIRLMRTAAAARSSTPPPAPGSADPRAGPSTRHRSTRKVQKAATDLEVPELRRG